MNIFWFQIFHINWHKRVNIHISNIKTSAKSIYFLSPQVDRAGSVDSYRFFREVPKEETTPLCVGQYLNGSEEEGVGEREVLIRGPRWKEGEDIWTCCPGLRWGEELEIGDLRPVGSLILELWQEATLWAAGPEHLSGGLGLGLRLGLCKILLSLPDFWANSIRCVALSWRDKDTWKRKKEEQMWRQTTLPWEFAFELLGLII